MGWSLIFEKATEQSFESRPTFLGCCNQALSLRRKYGASYHFAFDISLIDKAPFEMNHRKKIPKPERGRFQ